LREEEEEHKWELLPHQLWLEKKRLISGSHLVTEGLLLRKQCTVELHGIAGHNETTLANKAKLCATLSTLLRVTFTLLRQLFPTIIGRKWANFSIK